MDIFSGAISMPMARVLIVDFRQIVESIHNPPREGAIFIFLHSDGINLYVHGKEHADAVKASGYFKTAYDDGETVSFRASRDLGHVAKVISRMFTLI